MSKKSSIERKQIVFVRQLLRAKTAVMASDKKYRFSSNNQKVNLPLEEIRKLASKGIIDISHKRISMNSLSKNWLLRKMASNEFGKEEQFSEQHRNTKINNDGTRLNLNESPISRLAISNSSKKPYLESHHIEAAKRFSLLFRRSNLSSNVTMSYNDGQLAGAKYSPTSKMDISDMAIDARKNIEKLLSNLPSDCASIIIDVCGFEKGLQLVESERGWPRRSAKLVLRIGLEQLAQNFGFSKEAVGLNRKKPKYWLGDEARPTRFE